MVQWDMNETMAHTLLATTKLTTEMQFDPVISVTDPGIFIGGAPASLGGAPTQKGMPTQNSGYGKDV